MAESGIECAPFDIRPTLVLLALLAWGWWELAGTRSPPSSAPVASVVSKISDSELQRVIGEVYDVQTSQFIQRDLLWITLPVGADAQRVCQGIANLWAHRSGLDYVRVESWKGNQRLGQGTVHHGQIRTP